MVVRGELGWERQKARNDEIKVLGKDNTHGEDRVVKIIYRTSKDRLEREEAQKAKDPSVEISSTWCTYTRKRIIKLNLAEERRTERIPPEEEWNQLIREHIHEREQIKWRTECLLKPKLRIYSLLKKQLQEPSSQSTIEAASQSWSRSEEDKQTSNRARKVQEGSNNRKSMWKGNR